MSDYLTKRRERVAAALDLRGEIVLIGAGEPVPIPGGADQIYPFRAHSEYFYLADVECAGAVLTFDPREGWTHFVPHFTPEQRVWEILPELEGQPLESLAGWLAARRGQPRIMLGAELPQLRFDTAATAAAREALQHVRRPKDDVELERMRRAIAATAAGFRRAAGQIRPGLSERELQVELEAEFLRSGGTGLAFGTIIAAGGHAAVLHFSPTQQPMSAGDLVLIDAGAEVDRYAADVTRTFCVGELEGPRRDLYQLVLEAQIKAVERCRPGVEWRELHMATARDIAAGLVAMGVLRGEPDSLVEQDAHAVFFPHGVGHMVGLGVRDASGYLPGRRRSTRLGLGSLRMDLPLEAGYTVTIEPGAYFIRGLLNDPSIRQRYRDAIAWDRVEKLMNIGGVRIEDNVLVTKDQPDVLTRDIPKSL